MPLNHHQRKKKQDAKVILVEEKYVCVYVCMCEKETEKLR